MAFSEEGIGCQKYQFCANQYHYPTVLSTVMYAIQAASHNSTMGVRQGDTVFIKPNLVTHQYGRAIQDSTGDIYSVVTHPHVIAAVAEIAALALRGKGKIIIGDNPSIDADFSVLDKICQLSLTADYISRKYGIECEILDLRPRWTDNLDHYGYKFLTKALPGDPKGSKMIDLGSESFFHNSGLNPLLFRGVFYSRLPTILHHTFGRHRYAVSASVLDADILISVPKLKTHHKVGVTINIKGLVGTVQDKNTLVHWSIGYPKFGGDEFSSAESWLDYVKVYGEQLVRDVLPERVQYQLEKLIKFLGLTKHLARKPRFPCDFYRGAWSGNNSCWRMAADLYTCHKRNPQRKFSVIDGILGGEGLGPMTPTSKWSNIIIAGEDFLLVDAVACHIMNPTIDRPRYIKELLIRNPDTADALAIIAIELYGKDLVKPFFISPHGWD